MTCNYIKYSNIEYVMPFLFVNDLFIPVLNILLKDEKNPIKYVYGNVKSAWSGGRRSSCVIQNISKINKYIDKLVTKYNVTPAFTFTNRTMNSEVLKDEFCNNLLDIAYEKNCHFIVASKDLYNHITARYPDAHLVCSVIIPTIKIHEHSFNETEFYNKMLDKYEIVVLRPEYTMENIDILNNLINDVSRVEVLVNQVCHWNCPSALKHYDLIDKFENNLIPVNEFYQTIGEICPKYQNGYKSICMSDEIIDKLVNIGVTKFKIQGRHKYEYSTMLSELYKFFFNKKVPLEKISSNMDLICAKLIQGNKTAALNLF